MAKTLKEQIKKNRRENEKKDSFDEEAYKKKFAKDKAEAIDDMNKHIRKFRRTMIDWLKQKHKKNEILKKINEKIVNGLSNDKEIKLDLSEFDIVAKVTGSYDGFRGPHMTPFDHLDMKPVYLTYSYLDIMNDYRKRFNLDGKGYGDDFSFKFHKDSDFDLHRKERLYMRHYYSQYDDGDIVKLTMRYDIFQVIFTDGHHSGYDSSSNLDKIEIKLLPEKIIKYLDEQGIKAKETEDKKDILILTLK